MRSPDDLKRHELVWLDPTGRTGWPDAADASASDVARRWVRLGRPLVATRRHSGVPGGQCALGLPLPPGRGKRRIALCAPAAAVREVQPAPPLARVIAAAPVGWRGPLQALEDSARAAGIGFRVFGSLAWQHLTGEPYVSGRSDVDLLWRPAGTAQLRRGLETLLDWERRSGIRPDGEIELPDGAGVAWRELAAEPRAVIVKAPAGVALRPLADVIRLFPEETPGC